MVKIKLVERMANALNLSVFHLFNIFQRGLQISGMPADANLLRVLYAISRPFTQNIPYAISSIKSLTDIPLAHISTIPAVEV